MTRIEITSRAPADGGHRIERLLHHPVRPLVAGWEAERPAIRIWNYETGELREAGLIGEDAAPYRDGPPDWELKLPPGAAWHPNDPLLLVAAKDGVTRWTPQATSAAAHIFPSARYQDLAISPDGLTLWAAPSPRSTGDDYRSDAIDLGMWVIRPRLGWDTGIAVHPGGGLALTYQSDQGATLGLFARVDQDTWPADLRVLRRTLVLDCDGYETPVFSSDGRHFAIRGNAYGNSLEIFEFPSLRSVLYTSLDEPRPGRGEPGYGEWLERMRAWSRHNIAFGAEPGVLWAGTPDGTLVELDLDNEQAVKHDLLAGAPVTALCATPDGDLIAATGSGELVLIAVRTDPAQPDPEHPDATPSGPAQPDSANRRSDDAGSARQLVADFLDSTSEISGDGNLEEQLVMTDGRQTWDPDDLETVTETAPSAPSWLQIRAAMNTFGEQEG